MKSLFYILIVFIISCKSVTVIDSSLSNSFFLNNRDKGKIKEATIKIFENGKYKKKIISSYFPDGNKSHDIIYENDKNIESYTKFIYSYNDLDYDKDEIVIYKTNDDKKNIKLDINDISSRIIIKYTDIKRISEEIFYNSDSNIDKSIAYEYDSNGHIIKKRLFLNNSNDYYIKYFYNNNILLYSEKIDKDDNIKFKDLYKIKEDSIEIRNVDDKENLISTLIYYFDKNKNLKKTILYQYKDNKVIVENVYLFDYKYFVKYDDRSIENSNFSNTFNAIFALIGIAGDILPIIPVPFP